jgi:hypothetical protein
MATDGGNDDWLASSSTEDRFYSGTIRKLFSGSQTGVVRAASGREIPFTFAHVVMVGPLRRFEELREGMPVGFDVSWTSRGLCVTVLRPRVSEAHGGSPA